MNELAVREPQTIQRSAQDVVGMTHLVQEIMHAVMKEGHHYGTIPGCGDKPALFKPGAEKLCMTFRLAAMPTVVQVDLGNGHREYRTDCKLVHIPTGEVWGVGVGTCSTMESKYRWRGGKRKCPSCGKETIIQTKGGRNPGGFWCVPDKGGCNSNFDKNDKAVTDQSVTRTENPDIADQYNTVLKISKKRGLVDATLTATGASDIFTQDIEDLADQMDRVEPPAPLHPAPAQRDTPKPDKPTDQKVRLWKIAKKWTGLPAEDCTSALNEICSDMELPPVKECTPEQYAGIADWIEAKIAEKIDWKTWVNK